MPLRSLIICMWDACIIISPTKNICQDLYNFFCSGETNKRTWLKKDFRFRNMLDSDIKLFVRVNMIYENLLNVIYDSRTIEVLWGY